MYWWFVVGPGCDGGLIASRQSAKIVVLKSCTEGFPVFLALMMSADG